MKHILCSKSEPSEDEILAAISVASKDILSRLVWIRNGSSHSITISSDMTYEEIQKCIEEVKVD